MSEFSWTCDEVNPDKIKLLTLLLGDPNPIHFDEAAVRRLGLGDRVVNQGPANMAMVVNMLTETFPGAKLARLQTRLTGNVHAGDAVRAGGRVLNASTTDGVEKTSCAVWLDVVGNGRVLEGEAELYTHVNQKKRTGDTDGI